MKLLRNWPTRVSAVARRPVILALLWLMANAAHGQVLRTDAFRLDEKGRIVGEPGLRLYFPSKEYKLLRKRHYRLPTILPKQQADTLVTVSLPIARLDWSVDTLFQQQIDTLLITFPLQDVVRKSAYGQKRAYDEEWGHDYTLVARRLRRALAAGKDTLTSDYQTAGSYLPVMALLLAQGRTVAVRRQNQTSFAGYTVEIYGERENLADQLGWSAYVYETDRNFGYVFHYFYGCRGPKFR